MQILYAWLSNLQKPKSYIVKSVEVKSVEVRGKSGARI